MTIKFRWYHHVLGNLIYYICYWPRQAPRLWWLRFVLWRELRRNRKLRQRMADLTALRDALKAQAESLR